MIDILANFNEFIASMDARLLSVGIDLRRFPLDHVNFRVASMEDYQEYKQYWKKRSVLMTTKKFHGRNFHLFMLCEPLRYLDITIYSVEFTEPGGSDAYETGFQHLEILTPLTFEEIVPNSEYLKPYYYEGKERDNKYLKWEDKMVLKLRRTPLTYLATVEDNPVVELF